MALVPGFPLSPPAFSGCCVSYLGVLPVTQLPTKTGVKGEFPLQDTRLAQEYWLLFGRVGASLRTWMSTNLEAFMPDVCLVGFGS